MSKKASDRKDGLKITQKNIVDNFSHLMTLPNETDKHTLMHTIDNAINEVLSDLSNHESGDLPSDLLVKVHTTLTFLERCKSLGDQEFGAFARKRANELQIALNNTILRISNEREHQKAEAVKAAEKEVAKKTPVAAASPLPKIETPTLVNNEKAAQGFPYGREEKLLFDFSYKLISKRLAYLRGDTVKVQNLKQVHVSGIHEDGLSHFYLLSPRFPEFLASPLMELLVEKRDLLSRRIYVHTTSDSSDDDVLRLYEEDKRRDIVSILCLAFDDWSGTLARNSSIGLPEETSSRKTVKEDTSKDSIGSSLKKVFSLGGKKKEPEKVVQKKNNIESTPVRIHREWEQLENDNILFLSQHFSFKLISYVLQLNEKQFETEYECIAQIVNQQDEPDVGPVITNLSRLYKFYDNIFFDLVIVVLFYRKNKFDINMLQAACMSQNFVVDRLPLTMDELRRRPMDHAKNIVRNLETLPLRLDKIKQALVDYFYVHETIHANKVGKRIQASESYLKRQAMKLAHPHKKVLQEVEIILKDISALKDQQEENGTYLGDEIQTVIDEGISRSLIHIS